MKTFLKKMMVTVVCAAMLLTSPSVSLAASTAGSMDEMARVFAQHAMKRESDFSITYTGKKSDINKMMNDEDYTFFYSTVSIQDDPTTSDDADYLVGNIAYYYDKFQFYSVGKEVFFSLPYVETFDQTTYVNSQIPEILSKLGVASMSNYDKVKTIHDYVCNLITYSDTNQDSESCMYGALATGKALCNSYALCMYKLLVEAGIPCKYVVGTAGTGRDADAHAWNLVALGDKWYYLDATWDDLETGIVYDYFLKGSSDFDASDPSEPHKLDAVFTKGQFKELFPLATSAFAPTMMSDVNNSVMIGSGSTEPVSGDGDDTELTKDEVIEGVYPASGNFKVKRNKWTEVQVFIQKPAGTMVEDVTYKVKTGKSRIKNIENYGLLEDDGVYYTGLAFKGKKKGKVTLDIYLELINGQKMTCTFKGKVI